MHTSKILVPEDRIIVQKEANLLYSMIKMWSELPEAQGGVFRTDPYEGIDLYVRDCANKMVFWRLTPTSLLPKGYRHILSAFTLSLKRRWQFPSLGHVLCSHSLTIFFSPFVLVMPRKCTHLPTKALESGTIFE